MTKQLHADIQTFNFHLLENFNPWKIRYGIFWGYFCLVSIIPVTLTPEYPSGDCLSLTSFSSLLLRPRFSQLSRVPSFLALAFYRVSREK